MSPILNSCGRTSSPLTVQTSEESPFKPGYGARRALANILENISTTNNTPNKVVPLNETPHRATPLLTPPSSDDRPQANSGSNALPSSPSLPSSPLSMVQRKTVPLAEKILAQSALYSQAIQKQQRKTLVVSTAPTATPTVVDSGANLLLRLATQQTQPQPQQQQQQQHPAPQLTYSQLQQQQQQQFFTRQLLNNNSEVQKDSMDTNTKDKQPQVEPQSLTAVELPTGTETQEPEACPFGGETGGSRQIATIPKPDPLENPLRYVPVPPSVRLFNH